VSGPNDLLGLHLRELLDLVVPTQGGREVGIDGYIPLNERGEPRPLDFGRANQKSPEPTDLYEPRLGYLRRLLESLLEIVELESGGKPVDVDAFRLRDLNQWLAPGGGAGDIIAHAASACNLNCRFCYNSGAPPALSLAAREPDALHGEIMTRIEHYVPGARLNIFPNMGSPGEALAHPNILGILAKLREKTDEVFRISTNGSLLTPEMIGALGGLGPVYLDVSLNSSSPERRAWLMNDPSPEIAIESLALLKDAGIPFTIVIVPWPFPSRAAMLEDLEKSVVFASRFDPVIIQISLPGCARELSEEAQFPLDAVWGEIRETALKLRERVECPIVIRPGLYEDFGETPQSNGSTGDTTIAGVVKNSPAFKAGLRRGDSLLKVSGLAVRSRPQARSLLTTAHRSDLEETSLVVDRDGETLELPLDLTCGEYPYTPLTSTHLGAVFASAGVPAQWAENLRRLIASRKAERVLILTSRLVLPALEKMIAGNGALSSVKISLRVPRNDYFGGNIFMGDLMVVEDFIGAAREFIEQEGESPDLIIIPSSPFQLGGWGRDLTGRVYLDIERELGVPVALAECDPIFD
jgi:pyruvate-formate lyase-activating enzyme